MSLFPQVVKNTFFQGVGRAGTILFTLFSTALLTRFLGVSGYGDYVFILALVMFLVTLSDWGTSMIFVRESVKKRQEEQKFFGNAFFFRLLFSLIFLFLFNLFLFFWPSFGSLSFPLRLASFLLVLISLKTSSQIIFQVRLRFEYLALVDVFISFLFLLLLLFSFFGLKIIPSLSGVIIFSLVSNLLGVFLSLYWAFRLARLNFHPQKEIFSQILLEAMPTGALLIIFSVYNRLDILILQFFKGPEAVGFYGLAYKVHDNLILGAAYLSASLFPLISRFAHQEESREKLMVIYRKTFDLLFVGGLLVLFLTFLFSPFIIKIIGGPSFIQSVPLLRILVLATFFSYFNHLTGYTLIALGKQRVSLSIAALALFLNLSLNLIFIPRFSFWAASVLTIITEGFVFLLTSLYLAKKFKLQPSLSFPQTIMEIIKTRGKIF